MQLQSSSNPPPKKATRCRPFLGTFVEIETTHINDPLEGISQAFDIISDVHDSLNFYDSNSFLSKLNRERKISYTDLSYDITPLLTFIKELFLKTEGKFSPFVDSENKRIEFSSFPMNFDGSIIELNDKRAFLELGGIAKGFAVDLAIESLMRFGSESSVVNAGGDLRVFGKAQVIHIRDTNLAFTVFNEALATSSNNNKWESPGEFWIEDLANTSILKGIFSIKAPTCMIADALTKALVLGNSGVLNYFNAKLLHAPI